MRHVLVVSSAVLALTAACAQHSTDRDMQPNPGTGYTVTTTGAEIVGRDNPGAVEATPASIDDVATRMADQICDREVRCHAGKRSGGDCRRANLDRTKAELYSWRCSPAAMRARAERCLASVGAEPCELNLASRGSLCASNAACAADVR
jgi:hypothetical protein